MGFEDENGPLINDEHKIRIALSKKARAIILEDMETFNVAKETSFINEVFKNFRTEASASVMSFSERQRIHFRQLFQDIEVDEDTKNEFITAIIDNKIAGIRKRNKDMMISQDTSKLYHINQDNVEYLLNLCDEELEYKKPGIYIRSVIEEYCSKPFIEREAIYRKDVYDKTTQAIKNQNILKIRSPQDRNPKGNIFHVYPYRIVPDPYNTQSYLVCYTLPVGGSDKKMTLASFSMARLNMPIMLNSHFSLSKEEVRNIETQLSSNTPAYLLGESVEISVKLSERGKETYKKKLFSRPQLVKILDDDIFVFYCTPLQARNYFFSFGADAVIISPKELRDHFVRNYESAHAMYDNIK